MVIVVVVVVGSSSCWFGKNSSSSSKSFGFGTPFDSKQCVPSGRKYPGHRWATFGWRVRLRRVSSLNRARRHQARSF